MAIPERSAANTHGVSWRVVAEVELTEASEGFIVAHCSRFGGHALYARDGKLHYVYNFLGIPPEQRLVCDLPGPGTHLVGVEFTKERLGEFREGHGPARLYVGDQVMDEAEIRTMTAHFSLCGEGLCIGYDSSDAVTTDYRPRFDFTGGRVVKVVFDVSDDVYVDVEAHMAAAMSRG